VVPISVNNQDDNAIKQAAKELEEQKNSTYKLPLLCATLCR